MAAVVAEKLSRLFISVRQVPQLLAPPVPTTVSSSEVPRVFWKPYIHTGYRPVHQTWRYYFSTLFQQHNEAINVWTHLVATLILLLRFQQLSQRVDFGQDPHAQPLLIIITASITYLTFSTLAHLLQAKSEFWHYSFFFMDYVGVAIYQYGSALVHYYYAIEPSWHEKIQGFFMPTAALLAWLSCAGSCYAKFRYHQSAGLLGRLCQEMPSGLAYLLDISPVVHRICTASPAERTDPALLYHKCQVLFFLIGAFFFSHPYPEKLLPGKCYFFGQSHQIFHVFLVLCTLAQIEAVVLDYESRRHIYSSLQGDLAHHFSALCVFTVTCSVLTAAYMARKEGCGEQCVAVRVNDEHCSPTLAEDVILQDTIQLFRYELPLCYDGTISMGDWNFLGGILEEVHIHSTIIGKIWLTILFVFRMLVLGVATEDVWNDEQSEFICNTEQPGCRNVCYDEAFPISLIRYWVLQVIFVSSPSLVYMGHALYRLRALEKERQKKKAQVRVELESTELEMTEYRKRLERELRQLDQRKLNKAPLRGSLLCTYVIHIFTRSAVEVGFMIGQYLLYGFRLDPLYKCQRDPCPNVVDCFVSRPTEKTVFILFMQSIATVSLLLNVLEIIHLGFRKIKIGLCGQEDNKDDRGNFYTNKSKKYSVIPRSSLGISATPQKTLPSVLSGYAFLMEKQTDTAIYPVLNSAPVFQPVQNNHTENRGNYTHHHQENKLSKKRPATNAVAGQTQNAGINCSEGLLGRPGTERRSSQKEADQKHFLAGAQNADTAPRSFAEMLSQPPLQPFPVASLRRQHGVVSSWNCSAAAESVGSSTNSLTKSSSRRRSSLSTSQGQLPPKADSRHPSRPDTPDSAGEASTGSKQSRGCGSPQPLPLSGRLSLSSSASSRRAPTDLQI